MELFKEYCLVSVESNVLFEPLTSTTNKNGTTNDTPDHWIHNTINILEHTGELWSPQEWMGSTAYQIISVKSSWDNRHQGLRDQQLNSGHDLSNDFVTPTFRQTSPTMSAMKTGSENHSLDWLFYNKSPCKKFKDLKHIWLGSPCKN